MIIQVTHVDFKNKYVLISDPGVKNPEDKILHIIAAAWTLKKEIGFSFSIEEDYSVYGIALYCSAVSDFGKVKLDTKYLVSIETIKLSQGGSLAYALEKLVKETLDGTGWYEECHAIGGFNYDSGYEVSISSAGAFIDFGNKTDSWYTWGTQPLYVTTKDGKKKY